MKHYVVDAFTNRLFAGNPAAVCILPAWPCDELMQKIAIENNLSETAFAVKEGNFWHLRWFTPAGEIDLCGHATLATSWVLTNFVTPSVDCLQFITRSGLLTVTKEANRLTMNFPAFALKPAPVTDDLIDALGTRPVEAWLGDDLVCILESETDVRRLTPNLSKVKALPGCCLHVTARGADFDCVTRSFCPKVNVPEDPVCGRGHCHVIPYWSARLGKTNLRAFQASRRGGILYCRSAGDRVFLSGDAVLFSIAETRV